jgi:glucose dehydrogenase
MRRSLFILCGLIFLFGIIASIEITTTFQYIIAGVAFLSAAIILAGAAVADSIDKLTAEVKKKNG